MLTVCCVFPFSFGQTKREVLTNGKIIELVRLGLSEGLIIAKINRSDCQCDTSTEAIAKLKAAKVTDGVIMAMIESSGSDAAPTTATRTPEDRPHAKKVEPAESPQSAGSTILSKLSEPGIYLFEDGKLMQIEPAVFSGTKLNPLMGSLTLGVKKTKFRAKVRGSVANLQVTSSQPVFYFLFNPEIKTSGATMAGTLFWGLPATSPAEFMMVQMTVKQASREAVMGEFGAFTGMSMGARDKDIREYSFEKLRPGLYKVVPKTQLPQGEYCFYYAGNVTGLGFAGGKIFDFSVVGRL